MDREQLRLAAAAARDAGNELLRRLIEHHPEHEAPTCRSHSTGQARLNVGVETLEDAKAIAQADHDGG